MITPKIAKGYPLFMCRCSKEGKAECVGLLREVKEQLSRPNYKVTSANFLDSVCWSLCNLNAHIDHIYSDQWHLVVAKTFDGKFSHSVQCDMVEDGIAAIWKVFAERAKGMINES